MNIVLGFAPFIVFFLAMRLVSPGAGLIGAFCVSLLLCLHTGWRGESVEVLEVGSLVVFGLLALYTAIAAPAWTVATVRLAVDGGLLLIVLASLAVGRPFTLQYAREQVQPQYWTSPRFLATNRIITAGWAGAFAVLTAADAEAEYLPAIPLWVDTVVSIVALLGAVNLTLWYPAAVRRAAEVSQRLP